MRKDSRTKATQLLDRQITSYLHIPYDLSPSPLSKDLFLLRAEKKIQWGMLQPLVGS